MPWTCWLLGPSSLMMSPQNYVDMSHKWNISVAIGVVISSCIVSFNAVRERRQEHAMRLDKLISEGLSIEELISEGFTISELRSYGIWPEKYYPKKSKEKMYDVGLFSNHSDEQIKGRRTSSTSSPSGVSFSPSSVKFDHVWARSNSNGITSGEVSSSCGVEFYTTIGNLTASIVSSFTMESAFYRFPVELKRYIHHDGSMLTLVAEDLSATRENITTEVYKMKCIERVRAVAEQQQTHFKIRYDIPASTVITTIMECFVNISTGPASMVTAVFFLVQDHMGYIIQLQTHVDDYEARLADICRTLQSAKIAPIPRQPVGQQEHALLSGMRGEVFLVSLPLHFIVTRTTIGNTLALCYRHSDEWSGQILTWEPELKSEQKEHDDEVYVLIPDKLYLVSYWHSGGATHVNIIEEVKLLLAEISTTVVAEENRDLPTSRYVSKVLEMPLPPIDMFTTCVCNHTTDPFVNLFLESEDKEMFELEVGTLSLTEITDLPLLVNPLFSQPPLQRMGSAAGGKVTVMFVGETENGMTLHINALQITCANIWFVVKCLHTTKNEMPDALRRYIEFIIDGFSFSVVA
ncbi:uncharacterized protein TM35_000341630 [Trypanosoma theileri]|uniref:Uncharacterized protein n=1 Tax=Trypanosoma theileri TaxID=67003 RepID=A0A1X0NLW9_9TRYP|nr:uncharacterized protein TM35_000341630 [Trypanosoma theileri]ORC85551.1 hypothetical protein TM35_000341630 [Trypanosoma theileri]